MRIIVQKFGGTCVAEPRWRARSVERVLAARQEGFAVVVVVSAMGRAGDPYATDTLLGLVGESGGQADPREADLLVSCGEVIAVVLVSAALRGLGVDTVALTGAQAGIVTDAAFGNARIIRVETERLLAHLSRGCAAVVAGFQGATEDGEVTTLGRGGSDVSAAALGAALGAEVVEVYKDVGGIMTADPHLVPEARMIDVITYGELFQLAHEGAKVIHPRAVEIAMLANIPLRIRGAYDDSPGTLIVRDRRVAHGWLQAFEGRVVTAVAHVADIAQIRVATGSGEHPDAVLPIFKALAAAGVSVDLINVLPEVKLFSVPEAVAEKTAEIIRALGFAVEARRRCAKVSVVGAGMHGVPGVMAAVAEAMNEAGVTILQTADSHMTISCLVERDQMERAARALHERFGLGRLAGSP